MNEWITYDGTNPPTDTSRWLQVHYKNRREAVWASGTWGAEEFCGYADGAMMGIVAYRYLDLDSYAPPKPEMPETLMVTISKRGYEIALNDGPGVTHYRRERTVTVTVDTYTDVCECGRRWDKCLKPDYCPGCGGKIER